jgi:hypothetical protein
MSNEQLAMSNGEKGKEPDEMTLEEKLALLSEADKAYVCGYIDRAVMANEKGKVKSEK